MTRAFAGSGGRAPGVRGSEGAGSSSRQTGEPSTQGLIGHVLVLIQWMIAGQHPELQNLLREQPGSAQPVNVVRDLVTFFTLHVAFLRPDNLLLPAQMLATLTSLCTGPCSGNQELISVTRLCKVLNEVLSPQTSSLVLSSSLFTELAECGELPPGEGEVSGDVGGGGGWKRSAEVTMHLMDDDNAFLPVFAMAPSWDRTMGRTRMLLNKAEFEGPSVMEMDMVAMGLEAPGANGEDGGGREGGGRQEEWTEDQLRVWHETHLNLAQLRLASLKMLHGMLEGSTVASWDGYIHRRMIDQLNLDRLAAMADGTSELAASSAGDGDAVSGKLESELRSLRVREGFLAYILLAKLCDLEDADEKVVQAMGLYDLSTYERLRGRIEYVNENRELERLYFRIPDYCFNLTEERWDLFVGDIDRTNEKLRDFIVKSQDLAFELRTKSQRPLGDIGLYIQRRDSWWKLISFTVAILINTLMIAFWETRESGAVLWLPDSVRVLIYVLGVITLVSSGLTTLAYLMSLGPLILYKSWSPAEDGMDFGDLERDWLFYGKSAYFLLRDTRCLYYVAYFATALLGLVVSPFYFWFHLLDVVTRSATLRSVIHSVTFNASSIVFTLVLGFLAIYFYAIIGFNLMRDDFQLEGARYCDSLFLCLVTVANLGLRASGGIGDNMDLIPYRMDHSLARVVYDLSYFFLLVVIFLSLFLGIITDTFGELRAHRQFVQNEIRNHCFVCGIERSRLTRDGNGFGTHVGSEHNMRHYMFLISYLQRDVPLLDQSGQEAYISRKLGAYDTSFFPEQRAMCFEEEEARSHVEMWQLGRKVDELRADYDRIAALVDARAQNASQSQAKAVAGLERGLEGVVAEFHLELGKVFARGASAGASAASAGASAGASDASAASQ